MGFCVIYLCCGLGCDGWLWLACVFGELLLVIALFGFGSGYLGCWSVWAFAYDWFCIRLRCWWCTFIWFSIILRFAFVNLLVFSLKWDSVLGICFMGLVGGLLLELWIYRCCLFNLCLDLFGVISLSLCLFYWCSFVTVYLLGLL